MRPKYVIVFKECVYSEFDSEKEAIEWMRVHMSKFIDDYTIMQVWKVN